MSEKEIIKIIKKSILDKKGEKVEVIDVKKKTPFADYYIICSGSNFRQLDAIKNSVEDSLIKNKIKINHIEGRAESGWILIDAYQFIINIFSKIERERFDLENLLKTRK